jgi:Fe-S-cluster-containing dehydrogenase component
VEKGNPASQNPRSRLVRDAFARLDLLVVVDQVLTDTARLAHYVLPAKTMFEEEDVCTAYWHPYVQRRAKVWDPPGEVKTETEIWRLLCEHFGFETRYFPVNDQDVRRVLRGVLPDGMRLEELERGPRLAVAAREVAFDDLRFPTPSGRVEFASEEAARAWGVDPVPDYAPLPEGHASAAASRYPLQLLSCKTRDRIHSQFGTVDWVQQVERPHRLDMHPADAAVRGLGEGDLAEVFNDRGRIALTVRLDEGLRRGVVHALEGRCHDGDPDVNVLTDAGVTDMNYGATFYECLVQVEKVGPGRQVGSGPAVVGPAREAGQSASEVGPGRRPGQSAGPARSPQFAFVLDLGRCVGCSACVLACRLENGWTAETPWRRVLPLNLRRRPGGPTYFLSVACHHCERPACVAACPSGAYEKRPDGIVVHHAERCVGCRYCEMACPFGAPRYDADKRVMTKCHLCHHRLDADGSGRRGVGQASRLPDPPACVAACPAEALRLAAPGSIVAEGRELVPGFVDPAGCRPATRYIAPRGARREQLLRKLEERLERSDR